MQCCIVLDLTKRLWVSPGLATEPLSPDRDDYRGSPVVAAPPVRTWSLRVRHSTKCGNRDGPTPVNGGLVVWLNGLQAECAQRPPTPLPCCIGCSMPVDVCCCLSSIPVCLRTCRSLVVGLDSGCAWLHRGLHRSDGGPLAGCTVPQPDPSEKLAAELGTPPCSAALCPSRNTDQGV